MAADADRRSPAVVVGGGLVGLSAAWWMARLGVSALLLERGRLGDGSTGASVAMVRTHVTRLDEARLAVRSRDLLAGLPAEHGVDAGFHRSGYLQLFPPSQMARVEANVRRVRHLGVRTEVLEPAEAGRWLPGALTGDLGGVVWEPDSGYADPEQAVAAVAELASRAGAVLRPGCAVEAIEVAGGKVRGVRTAAGTVETGTVVVAAGAFSHRLLAPLGLTLPSRCLRLSTGRVRTPGGAALEPVVIDMALGGYYRPLPGGEEALLRVPDPESYAEIDPEAPVTGVREEDVRAAVHRWTRRCPALAAARPARGWARFDGYTPDGHPVLGPVPEVAGLWLAAGMSGKGFKLAPAIGQALAELITGGRTELIDIEPYRLSRFREGALLAGEDDYDEPPFGFFA